MIDISSIKFNDLKKYFPSCPRVRREAKEMFDKLANKLQYTDRTVLVAPTGLGKSELLVALAYYLAREKGMKVIYFARNKLARNNLTMRFAEVTASMIENGEEPANILVIYSKMDTCPLLHIDKEEMPAFYAMCRDKVKKHKCPYHENMKKYPIKLAEKPILLSGSPDMKIPKKYRRIKKYKTINNIPFLLNLTKLGKFNRICPYEFAKNMIKHYDIIVADMFYILLPFGIKDEMMRLPKEKTVVLIDEMHELVNMVMPTKVNLQRLRRILDRYGYDGGRLKDLMKYADILKDTEDYKRFKVAFIHTPETELKVLTDDEAEALLSHLIELYELYKAEEKEETDKKKSDKKKEEKITLRDISTIAKYRNIIRPEMRAWTGIGLDDDKLYIVAMYNKLVIPHANVTVGASATIADFEISLIFKMKKDHARRITAVVKSPFARRDYIYNLDARYENREEIAGKIKSMIDEMHRKPIIISNLSWQEYFKDLYILETTDDLKEREKNVRKAKGLIGKKSIVLSPHTSYAVAIDFLNPDKKYENTVIVASENTPIPDLNTLALRDYLIHVKKLKPEIAVTASALRVGVSRSIQAAGRFQRSKKHKLNVYWFGRHYPKMLHWYFYDEIYGEPEVM